MTRESLLPSHEPSEVNPQQQDLASGLVSELSPALAEMLTAASVLGLQGDTRTLAGVLGLGVETVVDLLDEAEARGLCHPEVPGRWRFERESALDVFYRHSSSVGRASLHAKAVEILGADPTTPPEVLAHHAMAAQPLFDAERAVALAAAAGEAALRRHGYRDALVWFQLALDTARAHQALRWRADLMVRCGDAHRRLGAADAARKDYHGATQLTDDPQLLARAALGYADPGADLGIAYRNEDRSVSDMLDRAIRAQPDCDSADLARLEARLAAELYFSDESARARTLVDTAMSRAARVGDLGVQIGAGAVRHDAFVVGQSDLSDQLAGSEQLLMWARQDGRPLGLLIAHRARVFDLLSAGLITDVDLEILGFRRVAEPLNNPAFLWWPALWASMRALLEGRHEQAEIAAEAAFDIGAGPFENLAFTNMSFLLFFLRREQGRFAEMESATRAAAEAQADIPAIRVALAFLLAETGKLDEARDRLRAIDDVELGRLRDRNWPASWFQLARVVAVTGASELAHVLLEGSRRPTERCVNVSLGTVCLGSRDLALAWLFHTVGELDLAEGHYTEAERVNAQIGARSWLAQAQADHARLLLDRGRPEDREEARALAEAAAVQVELGLRCLALTVEELNGRLDSPSADAPPPGAELLPLFRGTGDIWRVSFRGREVELPRTRGLGDIAYLLARPNESVSVMELAGEGGHLSVARGEPVFDERARRDIRERLRALEAEIDVAEMTGDGARAGEAREKRQALAEAVVRDLGLGGRSRQFDDPLERARKTVSKRIRRAIGSVGEVHPELGRHLDRSIDTGAWCAYRPSDSIDWQT